MPAQGEQACGEVGAGRLPEPEEIFSYSQRFLIDLDNLAFVQNFWQSQRVLISAGPTFEDLDPVRFIANRSSGKMGYAIAQAALNLGAQVTLISGPVSLSTPSGVQRIDVRSAQQMFAAVQQQYAQHSIFISAAAVADYRLEQPAEHKMKKQQGQEELTLKLVKNPDIVAWVAQQEDKPFVVGFAAETQNVEAYARDKLQRKNLDMICANQVGAELGFEQSDNALTLITEQCAVALPRSSKEAQALGLLAFIAERELA